MFFFFGLGCLGWLGGFENWVAVGVEGGLGWWVFVFGCFIFLSGVGLGVVFFLVVCVGMFWGGCYCVAGVCIWEWWVGCICVWWWRVWCVGVWFVVEIVRVL